MLFLPNHDADVVDGLPTNNQADTEMKHCKAWNPADALETQTLQNLWRYEWKGMGVFNKDDSNSW